MTAQELSGPVLHPSRPVADHVLSELVQTPQSLKDLREAAAGSWWALHPAWLDRALPDTEAERRARATYLAQEGGWDRPTRQRFLSSSAPAALPCRVELRDPDGNLLFAAEDRVVPEHPQVFDAVVAERVITGLPVELASGSMLGDPQRGTRWSGVSVGLHLLPVPGRGWVAEWGLVRTAAHADEPIDTGYAALHGIGRLPADLLEAGASLWIPPGEPSTVALHDPSLGALSCTILVDAPAPPGIFEVADFQLLDVGHLATAAGYQARLREWERLGHLWSSPGGLLALSGPDAADRAQQVLRAAESSARARACELELSLDSGEGDARTLLRFSGSIVPGRPLQLASGGSSRALTDWEANVAGAARVLEPELESLFHGAWGSVTFLGGGGAGAPVRLDLRVAQQQSLEVSEMLLGAEIKVLAGGEGFVHHPAERVLVEHPRAWTVRFQGERQLDDDGRLEASRSLRAPDGGSSTVRLRLRVGM